MDSTATYCGEGEIGQRDTVACLPSPWSLVAALGEDGFAAALLAFLQAMCDVEHLVIYSFAEETCTLVAAAGPDGGGVARGRADAYLAGQFWRRDPALRVCADGRGCAKVAREASGMRVALSLIRTDAGARYAAADVARLRGLSGDLVTLTAKHVLLSGGHERRAPPLTSLTAIERRVERTRPRLPRREAQVCARILYGMTSAGISLDLHIGEESAMTYRKRAYARLGIASQRELLLWYLGQAGDVEAQVDCPARWEAAA